MGNRVCSPPGPPTLREVEPGYWRVASIDLAPQIAHGHSNVLKAARAALRDESGLAGKGLAADIAWTTYRLGRREWPCCLLTRVGLMATFDHLHNVPACPDIGSVLAAYHRQFDEKYPRQPTLTWAKPAPDTAIAPPDPEPADTLAPAPPWEVSWRITDAIELLGNAEAPPEAVRVLKNWNNDRKWHELQKRARSWTDVERLFREHQVRGASH
jgi:hypothetical protein